MERNIELETDELTEDELVELSGKQDTCNGFAFAYLRNSDTDAVVKDAFVDASNSGCHCYVYDRDRDITIDVTLGQFNGCPDMGAWDGDHHPHVAEWEEIHEWQDEDEFGAHYSEMADAPYIV